MCITRKALKRKIDHFKKLLETEQEKNKILLSIITNYEERYLVENKPTGIEHVIR